MVVVQKGSIVEPNATFRKQLRDQLDVREHIVCSINEKAGSDAVPTLALLAVDLQEVTRGHGEVTISRNILAC